jgi:ribosome-associated translation inhibitor RaiA
MQEIKCKNTLKKVKNCIYVGTKISTNGKIQEEITGRICRVEKFYQTIRNINLNWEMSEKFKVMLHKIYVIHLNIWSRNLGTT